MRYLYIIFLLLYLSSCSGKASIKPVEVFDAEKSFAEANELASNDEYEKARAILIKIKNRDTSKKYAPLSQLRIADTYVREDEPDLAVAEYRKFIEMYPGHRYASYAQYQIAMIYFNQIESPERGYSGAAKALAEFEKLNRDYRRNPYRDIINIRIEKCRNIMADYEFLVGEFYLKKESYKAAIGRFETLIKTFPDYRKMPRVLLNLGVAHRKSGQKEKAAEYLDRLLKNYPNSSLVPYAEKELASLKAGPKSR